MALGAHKRKSSFNLKESSAHNNETVPFAFYFVSQKEFQTPMWFVLAELVVKCGTIAEQLREIRMKFCARIDDHSLLKGNSKIHRGQMWPSSATRPALSHFLHRYSLETTQKLPNICQLTFVSPLKAQTNESERFYQIYLRSNFSASHSLSS